MTTTRYASTTIGPRVDALGAWNAGQQFPGGSNLANLYEVALRRLISDRR